MRIELVCGWIRPKGVGLAKCLKWQMELLHLTNLLFVVSCITYCCADSIEISVDEDKLSVNIDGRNFPNPCRYSNCPVGKECTVQYTPKLLKIPVAHCESPTTKGSKDEGLCVEYTIGTNILSCKSTSEWKVVGTSQCPLGNSTHLVGTKVKYPCPTAKNYGELKYLTASFNCCLDKIQIRQVNISEDSIRYPKCSFPMAIYDLRRELGQPLKIAVSSLQTDGTVNYSEFEAQNLNTSRNIMYIIPIGSGLLLVLAMTLTLTAVGLRYQGNKNPKKNKQVERVTMKSVVNPEVDTSVIDCNDKSMLLANEQSFL